MFLHSNCFESQLKELISDKKATPGNILPSNNSNDAPPPVDTCDTFSPQPNLLHADAESPPPTMVIAPCSVAFANASTNAFVPALKFSISNTPGGPLNMMVLLFRIDSEMALIDSGPTSKPIKPSLIPLSSVACSILASFLKSSPHTKSVGKIIFTPFFFAFSMSEATILEPSSSYNDLPMLILLMALRNVKHIPPAIIISSTRSNNDSIT
mmetsp:Transcript_48683/g.80755  ORF Transcript_48683/g.80755 Transcript_48683/m.80755 type:complete len:211 (+) Transcript_48683:237-869(+)